MIEYEQWYPTRDKPNQHEVAGKPFRSAEDVDPIMAHMQGGENGERVWNAGWSHARLNLQLMQTVLLC